MASKLKDPLNIEKIVKTDKYIKDLKKQDYEKLYYFMLLARRFDETIVQMYKQGAVYGGCFSQRGSEASTVGPAYSLIDGDVLTPVHRQAGAMIVRGLTARQFFLNYLGKSESWTQGRDGNVHVGNIPLKVYGMISHLGEMTSISVGTSFAFKYKKLKNVTLNFIGDGATSTGAFHEAINFIAVHNLPVIVVIDNNQYGYSTPNSLSFKSSLTDRAAGYAVESIEVDGTDILKTYQVGKYAEEKARSGKGPTILITKTLRMRGHAEHDDFRYVPNKLLDEYDKKDPVKNFRKKLEAEKLLKVSEIEKIEAQVEKELVEGRAYAEKCPSPTAESAAGPIYAE